MPVFLTPPAATALTRVDPGWSHTLAEPTLASAWQAVTGTAIGDELLQWPPDLLALTEVILERSEAYRFALSPPAGAHWPPASLPGWPDTVTDAARQWSAWAENRDMDFPGLLAREWTALHARAEAPLSDLTDARDWRLCQALLTLHAIADEACAGLGVALYAAAADGVRYRARARELLARTGSLARIPARLIRVLPKAGTPASGSSARRGARNGGDRCHIRAGEPGGEVGLARRRPDRSGAGVPVWRNVPLPASTSFPSSHAAAGFAFAAAIGGDQPWLGLALRFLAAAVAYSRVHTGVH